MSAAAAFRLASHLASYPSIQAVARAARAEAEWEAGDDGTGVDAAASALDGFARAERRALEEEYVELFERGVAENPLHEGGWTRARGQGGAPGLADVAGFYRAFGVGAAGGERVDHLAVELEFFAWLLLKEAHLGAAGDREGVERVTDARRKFLADHLAPLALAVARRPAVSAHAVYGAVFAWIAELVAAEAGKLAVEPAALELAPAPLESDEVTCAVGPAPSGGRLPVVSS